MNLYAKHLVKKAKSKCTSKPIDDFVLNEITKNDNTKFQMSEEQNKFIVSKAPKEKFYFDFAAPLSVAKSPNNSIFHHRYDKQFFLVNIF